MSAPKPLQGLPEEHAARILRGTGIEWSEWIDHLTPVSDASHTELAGIALSLIEGRGLSRSPEWWAQGVAVAWEQCIGRRAPGERCDGTFSMTVSMTLPLALDEVARRFAAFMAPREELLGVPLDGPARTSSTEKWRYWRAGLADGTRVSVNMQAKGEGKSSVAVNHDGFPEATGKEGARAFWRGLLADFRDAAVGES